MKLVTKIKQQMFMHSCIKYQKLYSTKINHLGKLLVFLLAINYTAVAVGITYSGTGTCFLAGDDTSHSATPTGVFRHSVAITKDDLKDGKIVIDPKTFMFDSTITGLTVYKGDNALDCSQQVLGHNYVYEYISNHEGAGTIGEKSSIYFGLTPATDINNHYCLALFNYESSGEPALKLDIDELQTKLGSNKTLKSIVICSELSATNPREDALYITGPGTIKLTDGLIIARGARLNAYKGGTDTKGNAIHKAGLDFDGARAVQAPLTANIINYGGIEGRHGVRIGDSGGAPVGKDFPFYLLSADGDKIAKFYNYGKVLGVKNAFRIMGQQRVEVDTFELTNYDTGDITGSLFLVESTDITKTINFNVINNNKITTYATTDAVHITNYTGKTSSTLAFEFDNHSTGAPIAYFSENLYLEKFAKIVLEVSGTAQITLSAKKFTIVKAVNINLAQGSDMIVTPISNYIISATSINVTASIIEATLSVVQAPKLSPETKSYGPSFVPVVNALANIDRASNTAAAIAKIVSNNEIAGVNLKKAISDLPASGMLYSARNMCSSADEFFDILLPDSSNSQLSCNHAIANKLASQVTARLNSKSKVAVKTGTNRRKIDNQGINSGEVIDNISVWTAVNYFQNNTKSNDDKQSSNKFKAMTFSLGTDSQLDCNDTTIGLSYGFCSGSNETYGGSSGNQVITMPEEDLKTHTVTLYSSMNIQPVDMQVAFSFGSTKHTPKGIFNSPNYNSSIIGINFAITYPLDIEDFNIDFTGSLGVNIINTEEHINKYGTQTDKDSKSLVSLGLMTIINDIVSISDNVDLDYRFGIGGKYTISDDKSSSIIVENQSVTNPTSIDYKKRQISPFDFNIETSLNFQIQQNTHLGIDINFGIGKASTEFGAAAYVRYVF